MKLVMYIFSFFLFYIELSALERWFKIQTYPGPDCQGLSILLPFSNLNDNHFFLSEMYFYLFLRQGSTILGNYGWCSLRYGRDEKWPVLEDWFNKIHWMSR